MPNALVCVEKNQHRVKELVPLLTDFQGWDIRVCYDDEVNLEQLQAFLDEIDFHFLIYSKPLEPATLEELKVIRKRYPFLFIIYYNSCLHNQQFLKLSELGINSCIIGIQRKNYLKENLTHFWQQHWKHVPEKIYARPYSSLSVRAKRILTFIENRSLSHCKINTIASYLNISASHFRAEFKNEFKINFREFKRRLFGHYEAILLLEKNYKPNEVYRILNYSNIANLSRSFKTRHGESWRILNHADLKAAEKTVSSLSQ